MSDLRNPPLIALLKLEFVRQLSGNAQNNVVGLVRNTKETASRFGETPANLTFIEADIVDYRSLKVLSTIDLLRSGYSQVWLGSSNRGGELDRG